MHQDQDLAVELGHMPFAKTEEIFSFGGGEEEERQRKLRARVSSCGTFGERRKSGFGATGEREVDLGSDSELEELISDDASSMYSQGQSFTTPLPPSKQSSS